MSDLSGVIPAATLVLMRPGRGAPELLAMERNANMAFAPGAVVFPGGRIEADDVRLAESIAPNIEHAAARIAAIRETIEEVGIAAGVASPLEPAALSQVRRRLASGEPFSRIAGELGVELDLAALTPFAHWCPPENPVRRFDTLFFIAEGPADAPLAEVDNLEAVRSFWATAPQILMDAKAGRLHLIFPTKRNLERLAQFSSIDEARADAAAYPLQRVISRTEVREGARWICIPEGMGYPVTAERMDEAALGWEHRQ